MPKLDLFIDPVTASEALRWKCAFLAYPPEHPEGLNTPHFSMGFRLREAQGGDDCMDGHWKRAAASWQAAGYCPESFLILHQVLADLLEDHGLNELLDPVHLAGLGIGDGMREPGAERLGWHRGALRPQDWASIPSRLHTARFTELVLEVLQRG